VGSRRHALWQIPAVPRVPNPLFRWDESGKDVRTSRLARREALGEPSSSCRMVCDYEQREEVSTRLCRNIHKVAIEAKTE
jgi:hypothetical protein